MAEEPRKAGRPTDYTEATADEICDLLMDGWSMNKIVHLTRMPSRATIYRWIRDIPSFQEKYNAAREYQGDYSADYLNDIGEDVRNEVLSADRARVMADIHKWLAARRAPRKFGDQININQTNTNKTVTDTPETREESKAGWIAQFGNAKPD